MRIVMLWILVVFGGVFANAQSDTSNIRIDTMSTLSDSTFILYTIDEKEDGSDKFTALYYLINDQTFPVFDTIITLSKFAEKAEFFKHEGKIDEIYTIFQDEKYINRHSNYTLTKAARLDILKDIYRHIIYPEEAIENGITGRVLLDFLLNAEGCIVDITIEKSSSQILSQEALRAAKKCDCKFPVFRNQNSTLPSRLRLPFMFKLD